MQPKSVNPQAYRHAQLLITWAVTSGWGEMALASSLESVTDMSLVFGCSADLSNISNFEILRWFVSTQGWT